MTLQIKAEVLLNNSNWERNLKKTSKQMEGFGKSMKTIANGVKGAIALMGLNMIGDALMDVTKAAAEDKKSTDLLNKSLDNTWKATDKTKQQVDDYIQSMSNLTGIVDDNLRPAYATLARQTHSVTKANKMLTLAMNIAADKHISVDKAAKLVAKSMAGNKKAFDKLYPSASKYGDALQYVTDKTAGMAVAGSGPFEKINAIMDNFKEKLGKAFLPMFEKFAAYLASPEAQKGLDEIAKKVQAFGEWFASPDGQKAFKGWMKDLKTMLKLTADFLDLVGKVADLLDQSKEKKRSAGINAGVSMAYSGQKFNALPKAEQEERFQTGSGNFSTAGNTVVNIYGTVSGNEVVTALTKYAKGKGVPLSKLLK